MLQGGGALGAYEAGALSILCECLSHEDKLNEEKDGPLFDTIAGTSIGAMNAVVFVRNVVNRKISWKEGEQKCLNIFGQMRRKKRRKEMIKKEVYRLLLTIANGYWMTRAYTFAGLASWLCVAG